MKISSDGFGFEVQKLFKLFFITETMAIYFLLGLLTPLDLVRFAVFLCIGSGFLAEALRIASLLSPNPVGNIGLTGCGLRLLP